MQERKINKKILRGGQLKSYLSIFASGFWLCFVYTNTEGTKSGLLESNDASPANKTLFNLVSNLYLQLKGIEVPLTYNDHEFTARDMQTTERTQTRLFSQI